MNRDKRKHDEGDWFLSVAFPNGGSVYADGEWTYFQAGGVRLPSPYVPEVRDNMREAMRCYRDGHHIPANAPLFERWQLRRGDGSFTEPSPFAVIDGRPFDAGFVSACARRWPDGTWALGEAGVYRLAYLIVDGQAVAFIGQLCIEVEHAVAA